MATEMGVPFQNTSEKVKQEPDEEVEKETDEESDEEGMRASTIPEMVCINQLIFAKYLLSETDKGAFDWRSLK